MTTKTQVLMAAAGIIASIQVASAADITGKITLKGTPPPEQALPLDPLCGATRTDKPTTRFYAVDASGGLADVLVYIKEGLGDKKFPPPADPVVLDQKGCEYVPYVVGLQTGQKLVVKNSDPLLHNIHPTPTVAGNPESNKAQMQGAKPFEYVYSNPEVFLRVKCDVHNWMFAYIGVVNHPFFAVTQKDGTFKIANVPPGKYVLEAVHRKTHPNGKGIPKDVTVGNDSQKVDFVVEIPAK